MRSIAGIGAVSALLLPLALALSACDIYPSTRATGVVLDKETLLPLRGINVVTRVGPGGISDLTFTDSTGWFNVYIGSNSYDRDGSPTVNDDDADGYNDNYCRGFVVALEDGSTSPNPLLLERSPCD